MADKPEGSFSRAFWLSLILAVIIGWIPALGPLLAGLAGGRAARQPTRAFVAALLPAAIWGIALWYLSRTEIKLGGQYVVAGPLAFLAPVQAAGLLGGALIGSAGAAARIVGLLIFAAGLGYSVPKGNEVAKLVSEIVSATRVTAYEPEKNKSCPENL